MSFWKIIKGLQFKQLINLTSIFFRHPFFMFSTMYATIDVMKVVQKEYPDIHGGDNKANAFRHALWSVFIAKRCAKYSKNTNAILSWTKKITDWHEEFSPNEDLAKMMDLHNNSIGRKLYQSTENRSRNEWISLLKNELSKAVQIRSVEDIDKYSNQLIYLEN